MLTKTALVTGASQGIGKGAALALAQAGYDIALHCSSNIERANETADCIKLLGRRCEVIKTDLSKYEGVVELFNAFDEAFPRLDALVNNAGITVGGSLLEMDIETFDAVTAIDWRGGFFCVQFAAKRMIAAGIKGSIVLITSNQSTMVFGLSAAYGSVKAALRKFCEHAALELSPYGIRVNAIAPGYTDTGNPRLGSKEPTYNSIPANRWVTPEEIGKIALWLLSDEALSMTGMEIIVDGGARILSGAAGMAPIRERAEDIKSRLTRR
ncbi:MAG: SDR family oxidoreductase [Clostridiales bacterium]|nr:SDR family oxidoreductase [Clostridiales bacterium]